ncbi:MAG TPA: CvpA family protein, partial [Candidatus Binatia bacterium]|nr:CvpA family protein [Candidatus Binatia bacterium]
MNPLDAVAIVLVVLAVLLGYRSGALPQVGGLLGAIGGGAIVVISLPLLVEPLDNVSAALRPYVVLTGLLLAVGVGESLGSAIGRAIARSLGGGVLGAADRVAGGFTGAAQALLIVWLAGGLLAIGPIPRLTEVAQTSTAIRTLNAALPPPDEIATELGALLDDSGLPEVCVGLEPLPQPPVDPPTDATARAIGKLAEASTVRISAATCAFESSGSG